MKITKNKEMILNKKEAEEYAERCKTFLEVVTNAEKLKSILDDFKLKDSTIKILKTDVYFYKKDNWTKKAIIASYKKDIETNKKDIETKNQIIKIYETENKFNKKIIEDYEKSIKIKNAIIGVGTLAIAALAIKLLIN